MLHPEALESFRRMTPSQRLRITIDLMETAWLFLRRLPPDEAQRRLDLARQPWNPPAPPKSR